MTTNETPKTEADGSVERSVRPWEKCKEHGPASAGVWACPTCLVELRTENERLNALRRELQAERAQLLERLAQSGVQERRAVSAERERFVDALADACVAAEIPDSKFESLLIALRA